MTLYFVIHPPNLASNIVTSEQKRRENYNTWKKVCLQCIMLVRMLNALYSCGVFEGSHAMWICKAPSATQWGLPPLLSPRVAYVLTSWRHLRSSKMETSNKMASEYCMQCWSDDNNVRWRLWARRLANSNEKRQEYLNCHSHEFRETYPSVAFNFMSELIFWC